LHTGCPRDTGANAVTTNNALRQFATFLQPSLSNCNSEFRASSLHTAGIKNRSRRSLSPVLVTFALAGMRYDDDS
jgi:hypothetical protein